MTNKLASPTEFSNLRQDVSKMRFYYNEFHHKCMTWYIISVGFFIGGIIASDSTKYQGLTLLVLPFTLTLGYSFYSTVREYSTRIEGLNKYILPDCLDIPDDWELSNKKIEDKRIYGTGSRFFIHILIALQFAVVVLASAKSLYAVTP